MSYASLTLRSNANITFQRAFHMVWCPKYRRRVLGDLCRAVWNTALDQRRQYVDRYTRGRQGEFCGYHLQAAQLAEAKTEEPWLKVAPRMCFSRR